MSTNESEGRTFLDDFLDKAESVLDGVERFADGEKGVLPITFDDGSRILVDSIGSGMESTDGEPNWLVLRFYASEGTSHTRRYAREGGKIKRLLIGGDRR